MFLHLVGFVLLHSPNLFAQIGTSANYGYMSSYGAPNSVPPHPANGCQEFSLLAPGGSMEKIPARDQGDTGTCCGFAASGAIDAWRMSNEPQSVHFFTSPHALSANAAESKNPAIEMTNSQTSGIPGCFDIAQVFATAKKRGICSYDAVGANFTKDGMQIDQNGFWVDLTNDYKNWHKAYIKALERGDNKAAESALDTARTVLTNSMCNAGFSKDQFEDINDIKNFVEANDPIDALNKLISKLCSGHTEALPKDFPKAVSFSNSMLPANKKDITSRTQIYDKMFAAMFNFKNKQPIAISLCDGILQGDLSSVGVNAITGTRNSNCAGHEALVIGQKRLSDGRCGYLIRNSWGTDRDGASMFKLFSLKDTHGDVLVPKDALYNNLDGIAVLPPKDETYKPPENLYQTLPKQYQFTNGTVPMYNYYNPGQNPYAPSTPLQPTLPSGGSK